MNKTKILYSARTNALPSRLKKAFIPRRAAGILLLCVGLLTIVLAAPTHGQQDFRIVNFDDKQRPAWTFSASWTLDQEMLIVADLGFNTLRFYDKEGRFLNDIKKLPGIEGDFYPSAIRTHGDSYLLQNSNDHFLMLDKDFHVISQVRLIGKGNDKLTIGSIFDWTALGNSLLFFGDLKRVDGNNRISWSSAFIRLPLDEPSAFVILESMPYDVPERNNYLLGKPYLTTVGDTGYFLDLRSRGIYQEDLLAEKSQARRRINEDARFDALLAQRPELPEKIGPQHARVVFKASGEVTHISGLYELRNSLYMLIRFANETSKDRKWVLSEIDTQSGMITRSLALPTKASHLLVVPGESLCALIQKGPAVDLGEQEISSMVLIPTKLIEDENSPFLIDDSDLTSSN
ncbi:MAG: hypothetical protein GY835_18550 [bacterium]|nr:hypothetical protein [bacterium]